MTHNCSCGGRLHRSDIIAYYDSAARLTMYRDTDPLVAHFKCEACGQERQQRKRQSGVRAADPNRLQDPNR